MSESFRLLEGLELEKLSAERAIQEIQRIADKTLRDMAALYYVERLEAIAELARIAAARIENQAQSGSRGYSHKASERPLRKQSSGSRSVNGALRTQHDGQHR